MVGNMRHRALWVVLATGVAACDCSPELQVVGHTVITIDSPAANSTVLTGSTFDYHATANNNVGIVIPPGVAHAIRVEGTEDVIMVYGTTTVFHPEFEGRIASEIESAELPQAWQEFLREKSD